MKVCGLAQRFTSKKPVMPHSVSDDNGKVLWTL
jgi:hypothetical protein